MIQHETPAAATPSGGRQLAAVITGSVLALLVAAGLWVGAGYRAAGECRDSAYGVPRAGAAEMTDDGCRVNVEGRWSDPFPSRDSGLAFAALIAAASAALPPYVLVLRRRR
ncbi:MAG TPA: hypothetical protein VNS49_02570 [Streptomyces sp.]|nr:hypothetical protein [Streptomyces sp.]